MKSRLLYGVLLGLAALLGPFLTLAQPAETPRILLDKAIKELNQSHYPAAAALTQRAWDIARRQHDRRWEWEAINYMVEIAQTNRQMPEAVGYARQALAVAQALGNDTLITNSYISLGATLGESGQYRDADTYMQRALAGVRRQDNLLRVSHVLVNLAWNAVDLKNLPRARVYVDEAVGIARQRANPLAICNALDARAYIRMEQGQKAEAVADIEEALRVALASGRMKNILYVRSSMSELYEKAGRLAEALAAQRRYTALNDSLNSADVRREMAELSTRFGVKQQQDSIVSLKQQQRITALDADRAQARARLWGALAVGLALLLVVGGWLLRQVRRSRAQLAASEADLRVANAQKDQVNATKDQLMRIIGHDLRAPLATFQQFAPVLAELADAPNPAEQHELATALADRARAVGDLVDNLLNWSRAQAGQMQAVPQPVRLTVVAQSMERLFASVAAVKGVRLVVSCADHLPDPFLTDPNLLGAVLRNLLGNALKFTPPGGTVTLHIAPGLPAAAVALTVADTGRGMSAAQLAAALSGQPVSSTAGTNGEAGTGLGLAVCGYFVGLLGAEWRGESAAGAGTRWTLALPALS